MDATLDDWVRFVFDHPVTETAWHFDTEAPYLRPSPERPAHLIADAFERCGDLLRLFTDAQLNQGFWFLVCSGNADYICFLRLHTCWPRTHRATPTPPKPTE